MQIRDSSRNQLVAFLIQNKFARTFIFEFITCAFLVFMANNSGSLPPFEGHPSDANPFRFIYIALILYTCVAFSAPISGAHVNASITLAIFLAKKKLQKGDLKLIATFLIGQLLGCFLGVVLSKEIYGNGGPVYETSPQFIDLLKECIQQFFAVFMLIMSVFLVTNEETTFVYDEAWAHLVIGLMFYFCLTFSTNLHLLNPTITFAVQIQGMIYNDINISGFYATLAVIAAQLLAGFVSQLLFMKFLLPNMQKWKSKLT